jgi:hypothetical protein
MSKKILFQEKKCSTITKRLVILLLSNKKRRKKMIIEGQEIKVKRFVTKKAAENFINKKEGRHLIFFRAHEYFVNI